METEVRTQQDVQDSIADIIMADDEPEAVEEPVEGEVEEVEASDEVEAEEPVEAAEEEAEDGPEYVEMDIEGELYEIPVALKDSIMRQQDYTQKTQEVAEQRKAAEVAHAQVTQLQQEYEFAQSVQPEVLKAQQLEQTAEQYHQYLRDNIDTLTSTDIEKIRLTIEDTRNERDKLISELNNKTTEFQQAREQSRTELLNKGTEVLKQRIPNWNESEQKGLRDYGLSIGFTDDQMNNLIDPLQVESLWKAKQYDALKSGATPAVKRLQSAPAIKPKSRNPMPKETRRKLDLRKKIQSPNLSSKEKASLIAQDMGERFG